MSGCPPSPRELLLRGHCRSAGGDSTRGTVLGCLLGAVSEQTLRQGRSAVSEPEAGLCCARRPLSHPGGSGTGGEAASPGPTALHSGAPHTWAHPSSSPSFSPAFRLLSSFSYFMNNISNDQSDAFITESLEDLVGEDSPDTANRRGPLLLLSPPRGQHLEAPLPAAPVAFCTLLAAASALVCSSGSSVLTQIHSPPSSTLL